MKLPKILSALTLLAVSCQSGPQSEQHDHSATQTTNNPVASLEQQVLAVHDSVMPRMSDLLRLKKEVAAKVGKAREGAVKEEGTAIRSRLEQADEAMMEWMHQYNGDTLGKLEQAKAIEYLKDQQTKINQVHDQTQTSIMDAKKYLQ
jgi:hypothetical protein